MDSTRRTARLAGLLYLVSSIPGFFALLYVPGKLAAAAGDATAKADRIRASEGLLRMGIGAELVGTTIFIFVALVLYRLFKPVSEGHALAMLVLILLSVPISFLDVLTEIAALDFAGGGAKYLSVFDAHQRDALAYLSFHHHYLGLTVAEIFWGLWLFPFGICVIRSRFIPRFLGILLMIAGCGYVARAFSELVLPQYADAVGQVAKILTALETPIIFWLLIWGAKPQPVADVPSPPRAGEKVG
ncbi:MAG: DUF4386 domain-containing protein [Acidithiobacillales bacterium]